MMEAVRTSETSVENHFTRQYIPEDNSEHHTRRRENLKSHKCKSLSLKSRRNAFQKRVLPEQRHFSLSQTAISVPVLFPLLRAMPIGCVINYKRLVARRN
jgi:hypothetical protein